MSINTPDTAPPWGWNPGATFLTAYYAAQENQRNKEEFRMKMELERILLPQKQAAAEFNLKKLAYESKLLENSYRAQSADLDARYRAATSSGGGSGSGVAGAANSSPVQNNQKSDNYFDSMSTQNDDDMVQLPGA